jgi:ribosomal protein L37AE/L43A
MNRLWILISASSFAFWLTIAVSPSFAKVEYSKTEKKACPTCHVKAASKELNDVGKCYRDNKHSLAGCESKPAGESKK